MSRTRPRTERNLKIYHQGWAAAKAGKSLEDNPITGWRAWWWSPHWWRNGFNDYHKAKRNLSKAAEELWFMRHMGYGEKE